MFIIKIRVKYMDSMAQIKWNGRNWKYTAQKSIIILLDRKCRLFKNYIISCRKATKLYEKEIHIINQ